MSNQPRNPQQPGSMPWQQSQQPYPTQQQNQHYGQQQAPRPHGQNQQYQHYGQQQEATSQPHGATANQAFDWQGAPAQYGQQQAPSPQGHLQQYQQNNLPQGFGQSYPQGGPMLGQVRNTWGCVGLFIITFGFYGFYWIYSVYNEMKRFRGNGTGGGLAVLLMFVPFATYFMTPSEVASLYGSRQRMSPVSGATGLWVFLPLLGGLVWFLKTNDALNDFWRSEGAGQPTSQQHPALSA